MFTGSPEYRHILKFWSFMSVKQKFYKALNKFDWFTVINYCNVGINIRSKKGIVIKGGGRWANIGKVHKETKASNTTIPRWR